MTRLHVRYDTAHFPEDLVFQETADRSNFQGRYVLRHEWTGEGSCEAATPLSGRVAAALSTGGAGSRVADRMGHQRDPSIDEDPADASGARRVVAEDLEVREAASEEPRLRTIRTCRGGHHRICTLPTTYFFGK